MPEFTYEPYPRCLTVEEFSAEVPSSRGGSHTVTLEHGGPGGTGTRLRCPCEGFYYNGRCSHVERAEADRCGWDSFVDGGKVVLGVAGEPLCPECGGPTTYAQWAV